MLTADQIAEFRREHEWRFEYGPAAKLFAEICEQAAECKGWELNAREVAGHCGGYLFKMATLQEDRDKWRTLAERLGAIVDSYPAIGKRAELAELRAMQEAK